MAQSNSDNIDDRYFVDEDTFNCAFCKRNNIPYSITAWNRFDWANDKKAQLFLAKCSACEKTSLHLTFCAGLVEYHANNMGRIELDDDAELIDDKLIYSQPTSFFTLDSAIPREVREHIMDAENSVQMNLLTGASASLRKAIYTLLKIEDCLVLNKTTNHTDYKESVNQLQAEFSYVDESLFKSLGSIQGLTSNNVHEDSWDSWDRKNIRFLIELTKDTLADMYVVPAKRKERLEILAKLKQATMAPKANVKI